MAICTSLFLKSDSETATMPNPNAINLTSSGPSHIAGDPDQEVGLGPSSIRRSIMNSFSRGQTYGQRVRVLTDLLKTFGKLDSSAASRTLAELTERLILDIRNDHHANAGEEVTR